MLRPTSKAREKRPVDEVGRRDRTSFRRRALWLSILVSNHLPQGTKSSHFGSLLTGRSTLFSFFKVVLILNTVVTKIKEVVVFEQL